MAKPKIHRIPGQHVIGFSTEKTVFIVTGDGKSQKRRVRWVRNRKDGQDVIVIEDKK